MTWLLLLLLACGGDGPTPCAQAWSELATLRDGMRELAGDAVQAPAEATFLAACRRLPTEVQPCLSPRHALAHPSCDERLQALDPAQQEALTLDAPERTH